MHKLPRFNIDNPDPTDPFGLPACTIVGLPAPMRLPAPAAPLAAVESYCARHPPKIDAAVVIEIVPVDDTVVVEVDP